MKEQNNSNLKRKDEFKRKKKGGIIAVVALSLSVLFGFSALSVDLWNLYLVRNQMQVAADSAALAAATSLLKITPGNVSTAKTLANTILQKNQYVNGTNNTTITVSIPPGSYSGTTPTYANNSSYARIVITQNVTPFFAGILGIPSISVTANAVGGPQPLSTCVVTLATSGSGCFTKTGSGALTVSQGSINVNSNHSTAMINSGTGSLTVSQCNVCGGCSGKINGTLNTNTNAPVSDPFSNITLPSRPSSCGYSNCYLSSGNWSISPGTFCNGITITGTASATFQPGVYTIYGGGLKLTSSGTISGTGVTFYNTGTGTSSGSYPYGSIQITNSGTVNLTAPTSGTYLGMLCIQDPANTSSCSMTGHSTTKFAGNIYCPSAAVTFNCQSNQSNQMGAIVSKTCTMSGGGSMTMGTSYGLAGYAVLYN